MIHIYIYVYINTNYIHTHIYICIYNNNDDNDNKNATNDKKHMCIYIINSFSKWRSYPWTPCITGKRKRCQSNILTWPMFNYTKHGIQFQVISGICQTYNMIFPFFLCLGTIRKISARTATLAPWLALRSHPISLSGS